MDASDTPSSACRNCGAPLRGPYCSACGQRVFDIDRPLRDLATEWASSVASFDTRLLRTLWPLVRRPGFLTAEFLAGRRVRYVHPLKLYLAVSLVAFLVLALSGRAIVVVGGSDDGVVAPMRVTVNDPGGGTADLARSADAGDLSLLVRTLLRVVELYETDPAGFNRAFTRHLARSVFVLVPLVALFLRGLYRRSRYVHHLLAALHLQSFAFVALLAGLAIDAVAGGRDGPGGALAVVAVIVWSFLAMRRLHGEGRLRTAVKTSALAMCSLIALVTVMLATVVVTSLLV